MADKASSKAHRPKLSKILSLLSFRVGIVILFCLPWVSLGRDVRDNFEKLDEISAEEAFQWVAYKPLPVEGVNGVDSAEAQPVQSRHFFPSNSEAAITPDPIYQRLSSSQNTLKSQSFFEAVKTWIQGKKTEFQTLIVMARIRILKAKSEKIAQEQADWMRSYELGEIKLHIYPSGEWEKRAGELGLSDANTSLTVPNVYEWHHWRKENHERRLVGLQLLQEALDAVGINALNLILENAELPPVAEIVELEDPLQLQETVKYMTQVLKPLGLSFSQQP